MKCPKCQSEVGADARFCGECGTSIAVAAKPAPAPVRSSGPDLSGLRTIDDMETRSPRDGSPRVMQPGEVFADRYEIAAVVGEGGMGVVYRANDKLTEKQVALKLIRADRLAGKDAVKRLIREGVTSRDIRHPNVVAVYDVGEAGGQPYMSMEFLGGESMRAWNRRRMQQSTDCSMKTAANVIIEILAGLEAAHKVGVVHRDLKPENVMLQSEPNDNGAVLKILDFGVARAAGSGDTGASSLGTRGYMAPEQITAPDAAQPSADLYSLSVMFYELLVGVVPQGHWQPPSGGRSDVPPAIDKLIERGLSNNPRVRPQSTAEYGKLLADAMASRGGAGSNTWHEKIEQANFKPLVDNIKDNLDKIGIHVGGNTHQPVKTDNSVPAGGVDGKKWATQWAWIKAGFTKNYANGKGRASRMEYWSVVSALVVIGFITLMIDGAIWSDSMGGMDPTLMYEAFFAGRYVPPITGIALLALLAPAYAVASRRAHDQNITGWIAFIVLVPIVTIFLGVQAGTKGDNQYGPNPLGVSG